MTPYERQRLLLDRALDHLAEHSIPVSRALDDCIRLAQLRRDHANLWWLRLESVGIADKREMQTLDTEMASVFPKPTWDDVRHRMLLDYMERRSLTGDDGQPKVSSESLQEMETTLAALEDVVESSRPPLGLHPQDLYFAVERHQGIWAKTQPGIHGRRVILGRVRTRLARFLTETEAALEFGQAATGAFERVREVVDGMLAEIAPDALAKFKAAHDRATTGDPEAGSQALLSCRRILLSLADSLYPPTGQVIKGSDGNERIMSADKYRNRLWQFIAENVPHESARRLAQASMEEIGGRLDTVHDLASKGVHADVTSAEVDQCVVQTYLLAGDLLRLTGVTRTDPGQS